MAEGRPDVPIEIVRAVKVEAGHRCAIPTCRTISSLDLCHIVPWSKCKEHKFDNLILLCANCHRMEQDGKIDRKALFQYKANLALLNSRYGRIERRLIEEGVEYYQKFGRPKPRQLMVHELPGYSEIFVKGLLDDGVIVLVKTRSGLESMKGKKIGLDVQNLYALTEKGWDIVERAIKAEQVD